METFIVRVWTPGDGEAVGEREPLLGVIKRAGDAHVKPFRNEEELLATLRGRRPSDQRRPRGHARAFAEALEP